jgi:hypothetical protein
MVVPGQAHQFLRPNIPADNPGASAYQSFAIIGLTVNPGSTSWPSGTNQPEGIAYLGIGYRTNLGSPLLRKMDTIWTYADTEGQTWGFHSKDHPHHHDYLNSATGTYSFIPDWDQPISSGVAKEYFDGSSDTFLSLLRDGIARGEGTDEA